MQQQEKGYSKHSKLSGNLNSSTDIISTKAMLMNAISKVLRAK